MKMYFMFISLLISSVTLAQSPMPPCSTEAQIAAKQKAQSSVPTSYWPKGGTIEVVDQDTISIVLRNYFSSQATIVNYPFFIDVQLSLPGCEVENISALHATKYNSNFLDDTPHCCNACAALNGFQCPSGIPVCAHNGSCH